ncbi:MAG: cobalamin biosynthesis protein, partial [Eubacteriales bacterium]|nr:cobalamin biosynthesis protein [Eubacteriales bacterium]
MLRTAIALVIGFILDMFFGDPSNIPHPIVLIGKLISSVKDTVKNMMPATPAGERTAGGIMWVIVCLVSYLIPLWILKALGSVSWLPALAAESVMCWLILAAKSLKSESMKVHDAMEAGDIEGARHAVSMIVGRDTEHLDGPGIIRAAVETVAENTSDGIIAPMFYIALGGAPL